MIKRVNRLEELGEIIREGEPIEVLYDLGKGKERTELLVTYIDEESSYSARIASSPLIKLSGDNGRTLIDITDSGGETLKDIDDSDGTLREVTDSHGKVVQNAYRDLRLGSPRRTVFEEPTYMLDELGNLTVDLEGGRKLGISQYAREE